MQTCFALVPDNSTFSILTVPTKQELLDEAVAIQNSQTCSCCTHHAEPAPEELPGPPPNQPKQPCSKGKTEGQLQDTAASSGKTAAALDTSAVAPPPKSLAHEVSPISSFVTCPSSINRCWQRTAEKYLKYRKYRHSPCFRVQLHSL